MKIPVIRYIRTRYVMNNVTTIANSDVRYIGKLLRE